MTLLSTSQRYAIEAIEAHEKFRGAVRTAKEFAFDTGAALINAQANLQDGETFEALLAPYVEEGKISRTSAFRYMQFAFRMREWAQLEDPRLKRPDAITTRAREMVMQSAKDFLALMREAGGVLKPEEGGGHRSEKRIGGNGGQMFFSFDVFKDAFWGLEHLKFAPIRELAQTNRAELEETVERARKFVAAADEALAPGVLPRSGEVSDAEAEAEMPMSPCAACSVPTTGEWSIEADNGDELPICSSCSKYIEVPKLREMCAARGYPISPSQTSPLRGPTPEVS